MWLFALFICCLFPSVCCVGAAWLWGTIDAALIGTVAGGVLAVFTVIRLG